MLMNQGLTLNRTAGGAIPARTIVKFGADSKTVLAGAAATDDLLGVSCDVDAAIGDPCDFMIDGIAPVISGGNITRGKPVTSDANGHAVQAAPASGADVRILGIAMEDAVANDITGVFLAQSVMQGQ